MASIKFKNQMGIEHSYAEGFGGIDLCHSERGGAGASSLCNLDVRHDGSLCTRSGYSEKLELGGAVRAVFSSGNLFYCLAGNEFSRTDISSGITEVLGEVETLEGAADIFCYAGDVFVHDREKLYCLCEDTLSECEGYAPLYGKNWHPLYRGAVFEDLNLCSNRISISYSSISNISTYDLGFVPASIDLVEIAGTAYTAETCGLRLEGSIADIPAFTHIATGSSVIFRITLSENDRPRARLKGKTGSFVFSNSGGERLCLYSPESSNTVFYSRPIDSAALSDSRKTAPGSRSLYIPLSSEVMIGNGAYPVTGMASHYDRALLFTDANAWCIDFEREEANTLRLLPKIYLLNSAIGAEAACEAAHSGSDPLTYFRGRLFRWHSTSEIRDECSAELISDEVAELMPKNSEHLSMLSLPHTGEFFISDGNDDTGRMLVYSSDHRTWTEYRGIFAERLFAFDKNLAFSRGNKVYVFSDEHDCDRDDGTEIAIRSTFVSRFTDLGLPERFKRKIFIQLDCGKCRSARITLTTDRGETRSFDITGAGIIAQSIPMPRFKRVQIKLEGIGPLCINNIILSAK